MLPKSKEYLNDGGFSSTASAYMVIGLFLAGVIGIQILSGFLHHYIPSHVVDCDHTHDDEEGHDHSHGEEEMEEHHHDDQDVRANGVPVVKFVSPVNEETSLLSRQASLTPPDRRRVFSQSNPHSDGDSSSFVTAPPTRRPSMMPRVFTRTFRTLTAASAVRCGETGPCLGFTNPCGQDCFKGLSRRGTRRTVSDFSRRSTLRGFQDLRSIDPMPEFDESGNETDGEHGRSRATTNGTAFVPALRSRSATHHYHHPPGEHHESIKCTDRRGSTTSHSVQPEHHHHVPTNAFLSIGLQTSIAIALHKAPEGFITYATNHANPQLGFSVFVALFIHNITEGFAMALPLYLALGSRVQAMFWSAFLGGLSQPLGAGIAALWFKVAQGSSGTNDPSPGVYGGMFAVTAGVMASVALSLFSESLTLSHNKHICIGFAFLGMGILGVSFALTA